MDVGFKHSLKGERVTLSAEKFFQSERAAFQFVF
jgi:hypothetical protein